MLVVGLTGGIATGKSTVSTLLRDDFNVTVIDADKIARDVVLPGTPALRRIAAYFGQEILLPDRSLDRLKLGSVIFGDDEKRRVLNSIVHPAVRRAMLCQVVKAWLYGKKYCVIDVPLLIETGLSKWVGLVVVVSCSEEVQLSRLMSRDDSSREAATQRVNSQLPISSKAQHADIVIDNNGYREALEGQVRNFVERLERKTRWTWLLEWLIPPVGLLSAAVTLGLRALSRR